MKVVYLTAGAAGMYCGSCMRDNTLIAALRRQGRDVLLVPLYTPIRTDEEDVSENRVLYGGLNVYLQQHSALFRHTPQWFDRLLDSPALLRRVARGTGNTSYEKLAELTLSTLRGEQGRQAKEVRKLVRWLQQEKPDLVNLPNAMFVHLARPIREALGIPVVCTLTGEDVFLDKLPQSQRHEIVAMIRERGRDVAAFVAVTEYYASYSRERFEIPAEGMHVVHPGISVDENDSAMELPDRPFTVGYLARVCPDKGLHVACEALRILRQAGRDVRLVAAGYLGESDRPYVDELRREMAAAGLGDAFEYVGEVDRSGKLDLLRSIHVFTVPTVYREAKGLYVLEALAQGVPVVQPGHGSFPELIEATGGGLLVEPEDPRSLADGITQLMDDPDLRQELGSRGRRAVLESFTDEMMAERTWALYKEYVERG